METGLQCRSARDQARWRHHLLEDGLRVAVLSYRDRFGDTDGGGVVDGFSYAHTVGDQRAGHGA